MIKKFSILLLLITTFIVNHAWVKVYNNTDYNIVVEYDITTKRGGDIWGIKVGPLEHNSHQLSAVDMREDTKNVFLLRTDKDSPKDFSRVIKKVIEKIPGNLIVNVDYEDNQFKMTISLDPDIGFKGN